MLVILSLSRQAIFSSQDLPLEEAEHRLRADLRTCGLGAFVTCIWTIGAAPAERPKSKSARTLEASLEPARGEEEPLPTRLSCPRPALARLASRKDCPKTTGRRASARTTPPRRPPPHQRPPFPPHVSHGASDAATALEGRRARSKVVDHGAQSILHSALTAEARHSSSGRIQPPPSRVARTERRVDPNLERFRFGRGNGCARVS